MLKRKKYNAMEKPAEYWQHTANVVLDMAIYFIFVSLAVYFVIMLAPGMAILGDMIAGAWIILVGQLILTSVMFIRKRVAEVKAMQEEKKD